MSPVNYLKLDSVPGINDMRSIIDTLRQGAYFVTSGEVLIPTYEVRGTGNERTIVAEVESTSGSTSWRWCGATAKNRPADHFNDRPPALWREAFQNSVERYGEEVGAVRCLGRGDQRGAGATD